MVSLLHLADITEEGVAFQSPTDGQRMLLTPEHSMAIQVLGAWAGPESYICRIRSLHRVPEAKLCPAAPCTGSMAILWAGDALPHGARARVGWPGRPLPACRAPASRGGSWYRHLLSVYRHGL